MSRRVSAVCALLYSAAMPIAAACIGFYLIPTFAGVLVWLERANESVIPEVVSVHITFSLCLLILLFLGYEVWLRSQHNYNGPWMVRAYLFCLMSFVALWLLALSLPATLIYILMVITFVMPKYMTIES